MDNRIHSEPSTVTAEEGAVAQDGPDGVAVTFEPGAAVETGHRLIDQGLKAERDKELWPGGKRGANPPGSDG